MVLERCRLLQAIEEENTDLVAMLAIVISQR